jgi:hypothetical protein
VFFIFTVHLILILRFAAQQGGEKQVGLGGVGLDWVFTRRKKTGLAIFTKKKIAGLVMW